jgi:hypothetical protein
MGKDEMDQLMKFIENKLDDMCVRTVKTNKDLQEKLTTTLTPPKQAYQGEFNDLARKMEGLQIRMGDMTTLTNSMAGIQGKMDDLDSHGANFTPFLDKGEDAASWLRDFQNCAEFKGYNSEKQVKVLKLLLRNGAATWLDKVMDEDLTTAMTGDEKLQIIRTKFLERFDRENSWLQEHLISFVSQKVDEPVQQYYSNLVTRASRLKKPSSEILTIFIRGLVAPLKLYVLAREPSTLEQAFKLAKSAESLQTISDMTSNNQIRAYQWPGEIRPEATLPTKDKSETELRSLRDELIRLQGQVQNSQIRTKPRPQPLIKRCFYCNIPGHQLSQCRTRLKDISQRRNSRPQQPPNFRPAQPGYRPQPQTRAFTRPPVSQRNPAPFRRDLN